ncbi:MAG: response regulator transcription factor [Candidatus Melainabacteria bacterium]|nr:response regulator transcription factor [Candidatus Melainabacteria bacterium]
MSAQNPIQVLSVQSDDESRSSLQATLQHIQDVELIAEAADAKEALQKLDDRTIDLVLLDLGLSDTNGIDLTKQIRKRHPNVRLLVITASDQPDDIFAAMDAGADGYILKRSISKALEMAIRSVRLGAVWLDPAIAKQVLLVMEHKRTIPTRVLPTGVMTIPLLPEEQTILHEVASSTCVDGVCMVDPSFVAKLTRFSAAS